MRPAGRGLLAVMDAKNGQLFYRQKRRVGRTDLIALYRELIGACKADRLWLVQDNAPFLDCVQSFSTPMCFKNWSCRWGLGHIRLLSILGPPSGHPREAALSDGDLPVQVVPLPTYASWLNLIERLWCWLKQEVLHLHPCAANWKKLKQGVRDFLNQFTGASPGLLQYVGLYGA